MFYIPKPEFPYPAGKEQADLKARL